MLRICAVNIGNKKVDCEFSESCMFADSKLEYWTLLEKCSGTGNQHSSE
jgi:hypothetical protein